jgi:iron complex transport system substrate-binding protein
LPQCTRPKFNTEGSSKDIDQRVKTILEQALSVYSVDSLMLDDLAPTHIITQSQCEVCAVSLKDVQAAAGQLIRSKPTVVELHPDELADVWNDIRRVAAALAVPESGDELIDKLRGRLLAMWMRRATASANAVRDAGHELPSRRLAFIEWIEPLMAGGNWMPELVTMVSARNVFGEVGKHSPPLRFSDLVREDPDIIVVAPCGFSVERSLEDISVLTGQPQWAELKAVKSNSVFVADGNQFFNRPGPRLVDSAELLAEMIDASAGRAITSQWWRRI